MSYIEIKRKCCKYSANRIKVKKWKNVKKGIKKNNYNQDVIYFYIEVMERKDN